MTVEWKEQPEAVREAYERAIAAPANSAERVRLMAEYMRCRALAAQARTNENNERILGYQARALTDERLAHDVIRLGYELEGERMAVQERREIGTQLRVLGLELCRRFGVATPEQKS